MLEHIKKLGWLGVWPLVAAVFVALLIAFLYPQGKALSLQSKAGKIVAEHVAHVRQSQLDSVEGVFYCLIPTFHPELVSGEDLNRAIILLNEARSLAPGTAYTDFLLGQAYCLKQDYNQSIDALDSFLTKRPNNTLAKAEKGFAYAVLAQSGSDQLITQAQRSTSIQLLRDAGFSTNYYINQGDKAFEQEKYQESLDWYAFAKPYSDLGNSRFYREDMPLKLDGNLIIEPTELQIFSSGQSVVTRVEANQTTGILYTNSQIAGVLLDVTKSNNYCFSLNALDYPPQPTNIGIYFDQKNHSVLELKKGDGNWIQFDFDYFLEEGIHALGIKLMNDKFVEGEIDRNAFIGTVTITVCRDK